MKKMINIRNSIIIMLCITIICMGIGFAVLSMQLSKEKKEEPYFNVSFVKVKEEPSAKGGTLSPIGSHSITNNGKELNMKFTLNVPNDELAYSIIVKNEGNIPAKIINIKETPDYINDVTAASEIYPVTITHSDIIGKVIEPGEERVIKLMVLYNQSQIKKTKEISYNLSLIAASPER